MCVCVYIRGTRRFLRCSGRILIPGGTVARSRDGQLFAARAELYANARVVAVLAMRFCCRCGSEDEATALFYLSFFFASFWSCG